MATLIPAFSTCAQRMTSGERRLAQRLEDKLEADYLLWYDVPIGAKRLHPDFILLHPLRGLIVLEVKDWKLTTIQQINRETVTLLTDAGMKSVDNPLEQARRYTLAINQQLEQDRLLVQSEGRYQGRLAFPYSYGVVLTNITRQQFEAEGGLQAVLTPNLIICQDEMYESVDDYTFQRRLWDLCTCSFGEPLTPTQLDRIRWHLFPDVRIVSKQLSLLPDVPEEATAMIALPNLLQVMDIQQEQLARSLGEGHRVIHGVAGSGKTLILVYRCLHMAQETTKPILVLCFNVSLAARLRQMLHAKGIGSDRVQVRHFHGWCGELLRRHRLPKPSANEFQGTAYVEAVVQRVIQGVDADIIPAGSYGAVLIDEGHDFRPEWLKLAAQMVDPVTKALLLLYDDAQTLYGETKRQRFSFKHLGIQAQGRTTVLKLNYRNTEEILALAFAFAKEVMTPTEDNEEDMPLLVQPQSAGRHGAKPEFIRLPSFRHETEYLAARLEQLHERGMPWNEMAIVYRAKWMAEQVYDRCQQAQIPVEWINKDKDSQFYDSAAPSVKLVTMHSSKGLEFPVVFIPGIGYLPNQHSTPEAEARLLYVAMTRAVDQLVMTCDRPSEFGQRLEVALRSQKS
ncbi:NERD domain-containing protein [Leptolyngbya sp. FACHB-321]|uniref:3'-5' exonuclease n=1 Tax=Leptolyngbya sp. FACHB-321 TaxID=2692807 RepID=UPI0016877AD6|nr:3'-5' exonuclease [Leptolyngbya sp. FACHB-321]MBD2033580.1 NERD domain-containing protein [Leptolyngbya sp. FACHB-321]